MNKQEGARLYTHAGLAGQRNPWLALLNMYPRGDYTPSDHTMGQIPYYNALGRTDYLSGNSAGSVANFQQSRQTSLHVGHAQPGARLSVRGWRECQPPSRERLRQAMHEPRQSILRFLCG